MPVQDLNDSCFAMMLLICGAPGAAIKAQFRHNMQVKISGTSTI
jgi:hypothetical protein